MSPSATSDSPELASSPAASGVTELQNAVIRFAGNSQDGIQTIGGLLARLAGRSSREVMTYMTIPSTISGGPSIFQVHLGSGEVLSAGDESDFLFAFYQHSYDSHIGSLRPGGICIYDTDNVQEVKSDLDALHVGIPRRTLVATLRPLALIMLARYEEALASASKAAQLAPGNPNAHSYRGSALLQLGRVDEALAAYERMVRLAPKATKCRPATVWGRRS